MSDNDGSFQIGDVVYLKSGSPAMTVVDIAEYGKKSLEEAAGDPLYQSRNQSKGPFKKCECQYFDTRVSSFATVSLHSKALTKKVCLP